jgi:hypothetical protein
VVDTFSDGVTVLHHFEALMDGGASSVLWRCWVGTIRKA